MKSVNKKNSLVLNNNIILFLADGITNKSVISSSYLRKGLPINNYNLILDRNATDNEYLNEILYLQYVISKITTAAKHITMLFDRFGLLYKFKDYKIDRFPAVTNLEFRDICMNRVEEIMAKANGKEIVIMSSGGVDSLTVIACFVICGKLDNMRVVELISPETDYELIEIWKKLGVKYDVITDGTCPLNKNVFLVDGNCGDQLSHSLSMFNLNSLQVKQSKRYLRFLESNELFSAYMSYLPIRLANDAQKFWWLSFAFKFRITGYEHMPRFLGNKFGFFINPNNYAAFFCSEEFSDWAFTHYERNISFDVSIGANYKQAWKKIILEAITDTDQYDKIFNMGKATSLFHDDVKNQYTGNAYYVEYLMKNTERVTRAAKLHLSNKLCVIDSNGILKRVII